MAQIFYIAIVVEPTIRANLMSTKNDIRYKKILEGVIYLHGFYKIVQLWI